MAKEYPILRYTYEELHEIANDLIPDKRPEAGLVVPREFLEKAVDAIENMIETLQEWDKYADFLAVHGMLKSGLDDSDLTLEEIQRMATVATTNNETTMTINMSTGEVNYY